MNRLLTLLVVVCQLVAAAEQPPLTVSDYYLRTSVLTPMRPSYPEVAKQKNVTGVVVIMVRIRDRGKPTSTTVLEATDQILAKAVQDTVSATSFDLTRSGFQRGVYVAGRLIFYFHHDHDKWSVSYPDEF